VGRVVQQVADGPDAEARERFRALRTHALQILHGGVQPQRRTRPPSPGHQAPGYDRASNTSRSSSASPVPKNRIGTRTARSSATTLPPWRAVELVTISPVSGTARRRRALLHRVLSYGRVQRVRLVCARLLRAETRTTFFSSSSNRVGVEPPRRGRHNRRTERGATGRAPSPRRSRSWADRDQARRHRQGRERRGARAGVRVPIRFWAPAKHWTTRGVRRPIVRQAPGDRVTGTGGDAAAEHSVKYLKGVGPKRAERSRASRPDRRRLVVPRAHRYLDARRSRRWPRCRWAGGNVRRPRREHGRAPDPQGSARIRAVLRDDSGGGPLECAWPGQPFLSARSRGQLLLVTGPVRTITAGSSCRASS